MNVLGIESSCDETAAAVVRDDGVVLSDVVASQFDVHLPFGGVVPELASRAHLSNLIPVIEQAISVLPRGFADLDGIVGGRDVGWWGELQSARQLDNLSRQLRCFAKGQLQRRN